MDDINMIANEEQIAADLPLEETKVKKKLSKGKIILISVASFVGVLLLVWCVIGCPVPGSMASCEQHVGKSYAEYVNIYSDMYISYARNPKFALAENGEFCSARSDGGYFSIRPEARIYLTPLNFDSLLQKDLWTARHSDGEVDAAYIRQNYSSAWLYFDGKSEFLNFNLIILMEDGNIMIAGGHLLPMEYNDEVHAAEITGIVALDDYGDIQEFYKYAGVE